MAKSKAFDHRHYEDWRDPASLIPYEKNAKIHNEKQIKNLVTSINRFGWQQDCAVTSDGVLVIGHGRRLAAMQIGCEIPVHVIDKKADELTDEDIRELRIADNQTNAETGFDYNILQADLEGLDFDGFDFDFEDLANLDDYGTEFALPDGEKPEICQMSFTLHQEQKALIDYAISIIGDNVQETFGNTNKNGNALYEVVRQWAEQRK